MDQMYPYYIALWTSACVVAILLYVCEREAYAISHKEYRHFIFARWKVVTFIIAAAGMTVIAPYTGDVTRDYWDALIMSVLTFFTAPWCVGVVYRSIRRQVPLRQLYVAFCIWMFTVSWFYDTYILIRDGHYPATWLSNIFISSGLYVFAGLFWNLDWVPDRGTIFAFMGKDWPPCQVQPVFHRIIWFAIVFMALVALMILPFLLDNYLPIDSWLGKW
jgi:hypothetical protein